MVKVSLLLLTFGLALACGAPNLSQTRHFLLPLQHGVYSVQKQSRENEITTDDNSEEDTTELTDLTETTNIQTDASSTSVSSSILISTSSETTPDSTSASKIETSSTTELTSMSETPSTESIISSTVSPTLTTLLTTLISESSASQLSSSETSTSYSSISESSTHAASSNSSISHSCTESLTFYSTISVSATSHSSISSMESTTEVFSATTTQDPITDTSMKTIASTESSIDTTSKTSTELSSSVSPSTPTTITPKPSNDKEVLEQTKTILHEIQAQYTTLLDHLNNPDEKTVVSSRLTRDNDECITDVCKSLTEIMDLVEDRVDDVDSWTLQENKLVNLQTDSEELASKVEEAIADDDFLDDATFMKDEIEEHKTTIETAIKEVEAKISELDNNNNDDDENDDIVLIAVLGTLGGLLVLGLVGGAIYMFIIKPKKRGRDVQKSYSDDTDANVSKPGQTNLPTTSFSNTSTDKKLSPSDSDDSFSSDSEAEEITSVTITATGGGTLGNQQQMVSSTGTNTLVPISEL